jgi:hypothetical protein
MSVKRLWNDKDGAKEKYSNQYLSKGHTHTCHIHLRSYKLYGHIPRGGVTSNQCRRVVPCPVTLIWIILTSNGTLDTNLDMFKEFRV